jgi:DnaK suppressor protein
MLKQKDINILKDQLLDRKNHLIEETISSKDIIKELLNEKSYDDMDYAEISTDSHNLNILRDKQLQEIIEIDIALKKIQDGTYGTCEMCDEQIGLKRLRIKPHARFCIDCRPEYERSLKSSGSLMK